MSYNPIRIGVSLLFLLRGVSMSEKGRNRRFQHFHHHRCVMESKMAMEEIGLGRIFSLCQKEKGKKKAKDDLEHEGNGSVQ